MESPTHGNAHSTSERERDPVLPARPDLKIQDLCCGGLHERVDRRGLELFRQLRSLPQLSVVTWSSHNEMDRFTFARRVIGSIGIAPSTLLRCYLATAVERLRREGHPYGKLAKVFGYADASSLHRALRRHAHNCTAHA